MALFDFIACATWKLQSLNQATSLLPTILAFCFTSNLVSIIDFTPNHAGTVSSTEFQQRLSVRMSRIPYLSSELSPWPRIHLSEVSSNNSPVNQPTTFPRLRRGSSQRSGNTASSIKSRGRASSDVGPLPAKSQARDRSTSFGSTQEYEDATRSGPAQRLDRRIINQKVQELLKLRKQKLKEAEREGDEVELFRLKNLNLFDDIEKVKDEKDEPKEVESSGDFTEQTDHHGFTSQIEVLDSGFTPPPRPKSVNQGHTATLCWHLKLEYTQGMTVPEEFSHCNIHPTPSPCPTSNSNLILQPASPSSSSSGSRRSLRHTKVSSIDSTTLREFSEPSSPATSTSTAIASESSSLTKDSFVALKANEEDPFLYIAKYIAKHGKGDKTFREAKRSGLQASSANAEHSNHAQCTCPNHNCCTYLHGPPSKHRRFCILPRLQPEIAAAVDRIEETKTSVFAQADATSPAKEQCEAEEFRKFEALQEDMKLVEMYNAETEKRCRNGVWWEGWLIVKDLKRKGIVGSKPYVYEGDSLVA